MNMLISLKGTLGQTGKEVGSVSLPIKGPIKGQYVFLMTKFQTLIGSIFSIFISISRDLTSVSLK